MSLSNQLVLVSQRTTNHKPDNPRILDGVQTFGGECVSLFYFVLFVCLLACLLVCLFVFFLGGGGILGPDKEWPSPYLPFRHPAQRRLC